MGRLYLCVTMVISAISCHSSALACSICRCGDQAFFINNANLLPRGSWVVTIENLYLNKSSLHEEIQSNHHDLELPKSSSPLEISHGDESDLQSHRQNNLQIVLNYGLTNRMMLLASFPYTFNSFSQDNEHLRINGFGDPELAAILNIATLLNGSLTIAANIGVRLPFGKTDHRNNKAELLDSHDQIGSGAFASLVGFQINRFNYEIPFFFSATYQLNGANAHDFRYGNVFRFNLATQRPLSYRLDIIVEVNGRMADFDKKTNLKNPNSGGTMLYFSPGLRLHLPGSLALRGQVQIPILEKLNGVQNEKTNLRVGLVWSL